METIISWILILACILGGIGNFLAKNYGEALQFFILAGLVIQVEFGDKK